MTDRLNARRTPDPGTENCQFRYSDTCVNCGKPIVAELIGVLVTGDLYDWRHKSPWSPYCGGRVDRRAPQAIPAAEAEAECTVHRKVTRWHHCEDGGTVVFLETEDGAWTGGVTSQDGRYHANRSGRPERVHRGPGEAVDESWPLRPVPVD